MSEQVIRQKIFEIIAGQEGIATPSFASADFGMVHKFERWTADWGKFLELFKDPVTGRIFGFELSRSGSPAQKLSNFEEADTHIYTIKGYMAVKDADQTEILFNGKIEALKDKFRRKHDLDGTCNAAGPLSAETIDTRFFGATLCHYAELNLPATEIV